MYIGFCTRVICVYIIYTKKQNDADEVNPIPAKTGRTRLQKSNSSSLARISNNSVRCSLPGVVGRFCQVMVLIVRPRHSGVILIPMTSSRPCHGYPVKRPRETNGLSPCEVTEGAACRHSVDHDNEGKNEMDRLLQVSPRPRDINLGFAMRSGNCWIGVLWGLQLCYIGIQQAEG